jgi:hypothetical protein
MLKSRVDSRGPKESVVMRSPFPGMDPYLEQFWGDLHHTMITSSRAAIQRQLPADLVARVDERIVVEPSDGTRRKIIPDVRVVERGQREEPVIRASNGIAVAEPLVVHVVEDEPERQGYIEILDRGSGRRLVTVIEILSPSNKVPGPGRDLYLKKQEELRQGGVSLVEINLNRTGSHVFMVPFNRIPEGQATPYAACIRRAWKPFDLEYYRLPLRERLPAIAVPLRPEDFYVPLDLQAILNECCEEGRYVEDIDYHEDSDPPLPSDDAQWADALLREQGRR